jgi:uncharacterized protein YkwD
VSTPIKVLLALVLVAAWTFAAGSSASAASCPNAGLPAPTLGIAQIESSIDCLINEERSSRGLDPLQPSGNLRAAALSHSTEMVSQGYFEHTSPSGATFIDRIEDAGYTRGTRIWVVGEDLLWGTGPLSTPQSVVGSWMESPPHRENILRARFKEIGTAVVPGTPELASDSTGVTVSSEFGDRTFGKRGGATRSTHKAGAQRATR